jgi:hypothetical protein
MLKLADAAAAALYGQMLERFQHQVIDLSHLVDRISAQRLDKEKISTTLAEMEASAGALQDKIGRLQADLEQLNA